MLRIDVIESSSHAVGLRLEGRVIGPWVGELRQSCERALAQGARLTLDLADVSFIDGDGIALFRSLKDRRVALRSCAPFVAEQLREVFREEVSPW